jgi:hypothetical protein
VSCSNAAGKLAALVLLTDGMLVSNAVCKHDHNVFSIHAIKIQEREICQAVSAQITAKVMSQVCEKTLMKTERGLNLWLKDINHKHVPTDCKCYKVM